MQVAKEVGIELTPEANALDSVKTQSFAAQCLGTVAGIFFVIAFYGFLRFLRKG